MQNITYAIYTIVKNLSNKKSAKVICRFDRLWTAHTKRQKAIWALEKLSATHTFEYILFKVNPGLNSGEDHAAEVDNSLDNN